jgi:hypothetical protein
MEGYGSKQECELLESVRWLPQLLFAASGALLLLQSALQMGRRQRGVRLSSAAGSQPT